MKTSRVVALVLGCLLVLPAGAMLLGGGALAAAYAFARDDGYFTATIDRVATDTVAVTADDLNFGADPGSPDWLVDALDVDVRLDVRPGPNQRDVFVGVGPAADVRAYLDGAAHERIVDVDDGLVPEYEAVTGTGEVAPPTEQTFWVAQATGAGPQELAWEADEGEWAVVMMNADASPGVAAEVQVGAKSDAVLPLALILLGVGAALLAGAVALIVFGAKAASAQRAPAAAPAAWGAPAGIAPADPVAIRAELDPGLSRWMWLVKWILAIPHVIVLVFLWIAFVVLTIVAGFAILFTGRYPRGIFDFNVGVLRWSWRVSYYAWSGGIGTDRYPPFTLQPQPGDPARLDVAYPERLSRWMVLVAGVVLLFTGRYPQALFDLIVGLNRWVYRVIAYIALMTDRYPPFRLDQGGEEPAPPSGSPPPTDGSRAAPLPPPAAAAPDHAPTAAAGVHG